MEDMTVEQVCRLATAKDYVKLKVCSQDSLINAVVRLSSMYRAAKGDSPYDKMVQQILDVQQNIEQADFVRAMKKIEQQLTDTENERDRLQEDCDELEERVKEIEAQLENRHAGGRPKQYDSQFRARVIAFYQAGHTYVETAKHFGVSTNTVGRFLK